MLTEHERQLNAVRVAMWHKRHPEYYSDYYQRNKGKLQVYNRNWKNAHRARVGVLESALRYKLKAEVMAHYQTEVDLKCAYCGIGDIRILSIDHINGGGAEHLRQIGYSSGGASLYRWLRNNNYPKGYQVLCLNCNTIKRIENKENGIKHGKGDKK